MDLIKHHTIKAEEMALIQQSRDRGSLWGWRQRLAHIILRPSAYT